MEFSQRKRIFGPKIKDRILYIIRSVADTQDVDEFRYMLVEGFKTLQFQDIEGYVPCESRLYLTHNQVHMFLYEQIRPRNSYFFKENEEYIGGGEYQNGMTFEVFREIVNTSVGILTKKQRCRD